MAELPNVKETPHGGETCHIVAPPPCRHLCDHTRSRTLTFPRRVFSLPPLSLLILSSTVTLFPFSSFSHFFLSPTSPFIHLSPPCVTSLSFPCRPSFPFPSLYPYLPSALSLLPLPFPFLYISLPFSRFLPPSLSLRSLPSLSLSLIAVIAAIVAAAVSVVALSLEIAGALLAKLIRLCD